MDVQAFDRLIDSLAHFYPPGFSRPLFFDNHDMDRFTWIAKGDTRKLKAVSLCLFTLPDVPFLYYGTEVGVPQLLGSGSPGSIGHAECRRPMIWGDEQDQDLLTYFRWLVHFRKDHPVIWTGARDTLHVDPAANTYVYRIQDEHEILLVAFNLSDKPSTIHLEPSTHSIEHTFALDAWGSAVQVFLAKG
jgi:glycosidase